MVEVYVADTAGLPDPSEAPAALRGIPLERAERIVRLPSPEKRREALGARMLLEGKLREYGIEGETIVTGAHGKPLHGRLFFNLSHSGGKVALALSRSGEVGCDIEVLRERNFAHILPRLSEAERAYLMRSGGMRAFLEVWTMRESYLKMTGEGLTGWERIRLLPEARKVVREGREEDCAFKIYSAGEYVLTVCAREELPETVQWVDLG